MDRFIPPYEAYAPVAAKCDYCSRDILVSEPVTAIADPTREFVVHERCERMAIESYYIAERGIIDEEGDVI
ncbi:hypothetical protein [Paenibacillus sp. 1P03SA]|uniref:hypothetical protein n=1 Tax=Paenibacillus sp. 1P03SA TaxID=3132294 RepID=UPI0039A2E9E2